MKKKILLYSVAVIAFFSLQSCVTNYVVSTPATYLNEYKSNAKLASIENAKLEEAKSQLLNSFADQKIAAERNSRKNEEIAKVVRFTKKIDEILTEAESYLGTPYRYGGTTRRGIDCSAFVLSVFGAAAGMNLPRVAAAQAQEGERIGKDDLQKGDLIFFAHRGGNRISHVAIVESITPEGEVKFIHASSSKGVTITSLNDSYWNPRFKFAKRIITPEAFDNNFANN